VGGYTLFKFTSTKAFALTVADHTPYAKLYRPRPLNSLYFRLLTRHLRPYFRLHASESFLCSSKAFLLAGHSLNLLTVFRLTFIIGSMPLSSRMLKLRLESYAPSPITPFTFTDFVGDRNQGLWRGEGDPLVRIPKIRKQTSVKLDRRGVIESYRPQALSNTLTLS